MTDANVIAALTAVLAELPGIGKDSQAAAQQGGYAYRGIEAITRQAAPLFAKHGIVFVPRVVSWERDQITVAQRPWTDDRMQIEYTVYGPGGKDDCIVVGPIPAVGRDNSDKGANKCMTQAFKYALLQVLCVADSKDDGDGETHEADARPKPASKERIDMLRACIPPDLRDGIKQQFAWPWTDATCDLIEILIEPGDGTEGMEDPF